MIFFCIFQTLNAFSCDLLVFAINVFKTNIFAFIRTLFLTPTFFLANTSNRFFAHFLCFFSPWLSGFLDYLGLQTALWEILRILCENLWRNKLPKLTTLNPIFQLLHSAMVMMAMMMTMMTMIIWGHWGTVEWDDGNFRWKPRGLLSLCHSQHFHQKPLYFSYSKSVFLKYFKSYFFSFCKLYFSDSNNTFLESCNIYFWYVKVGTIRLSL